MADKPYSYGGSGGGLGLVLSGISDAYNAYKNYRDDKKGTVSNNTPPPPSEYDEALDNQGYGPEADLKQARKQVASKMYMGS